MASKQKTSTDSHAVRRIKYGLSVSVAVLMAVGIVVLVNWLAARQYIRKDLTSGGSYSLSAQSKTVLDKLEDGHRIVTLLGTVADEDRTLVYQRVKDMASEYGQYAENLTVKHLNPRSDISEVEKLNAEVTKAFSAELTPVIEAIDEGRAALASVQPINKRLIAVMTRGLQTESGQAETPTQELFRAAASGCTQFGQTAEEAERQVEDLMSQTLVNYAQIKTQFQQVLTNYDTVLGVITQRAGMAARLAGTDNAEKELLLEAIELCKQAQAQLSEPIAKMNQAEDAPRYHYVLYGLSSGASVVLLGPDQVKVIPVSDMWRQDLRNAAETGRAQPQYLIEEKMTGALLSMTLEQPPLVVFVLSGSGAAIGSQGQFNIVAQRLESADFRVTQWNPAGQVSAMGQPTPPMPRPEPEPGQKTVWVILPTPGNTMGNPMMMMANPPQQIAELLRERLAAGDSAMVLLAADPSTNFGMANPITELLSEWGITAQTDRIILEEVPQANRRNATAMQFLVDTWPSELPLTSALDGMQAVFMAASPILTGNDQGATHHSLVELTGDRLWTHTELTSPEAVQSAKFNEASGAPSFTIATASEKDGKRLITIGEQIWASDDMTGYGLLGPGTAELTGSMFPGNSELFVNSVFWLAGLEDLIAASPRSQDVPRVRPMSASELWWHQMLLLAGMPAVALILGLSVWSVRRWA